MTEQKPSICRMVVFNHPSTKDRSGPNVQSPAIVRKVNDDATVDLVIFMSQGGTIFRDKLEQGDGEYQWNWPPR